MATNLDILRLKAIKAILDQVDDEDDPEDAAQALDLVRVLVAKSPERWDTVRHEPSPRLTVRPDPSDMAT